MSPATRTTKPATSTSPSATLQAPDRSKTGKFKITLAQVVEQYAAKKGARFDYNPKMVKLEKKNGRVTGVIAENADGKSTSATTPRRAS